MITVAAATLAYEDNHINVPTNTLSLAGPSQPGLEIGSSPGTSKMTTAEDCHRKAGEWLKAAQAAADPKTSESMRRVSDLWVTLAQQINHTNSAAAHFNSLAKRPADLARRESFRRVESVEIADVLRHRLSLDLELEDGTE